MEQKQILKTKEVEEQDEKAMLEFSDLLGIGMTLVVLGIGLAYGADITSDVQSDQVTGTYHCGLNATNGTGGTLLYDSCGASYNVTNNSLLGLNKLSLKLPTIVGVMVAAVIIGVLIRHLYIKYAA